jgi:hypothetical protein
LDELRLPESLHEPLKAVAEREGVSINPFIATAVAEKLSAFDDRRRPRHRRGWERE